MANVLNRTTKQFISSVNEPDYPQINWIWNPNLTAVVGFDSRYWVITGDVVTLLTIEERDALDATALINTRDAVVNGVYDNTEDILRASLQVIREELNSHAMKINTILDAVDAATSLADLKTRVATITDYPQRTLEQLRTSIRNNIGV